jgi:hypothetical protein
MYFGEFKNKSDICEQFRISDFDGTVLLAVYNQEDYEGSAEVIFVNGGQIYMVQGSHCSCCGLEDQWEPVEMSVDGLRHIIEKGNGLLSRYQEGLSGALEMLEVLNLDGAAPHVVHIALKLAFD